MANSPRTVTAILGVDFDQRDTTPVYPIGTLCHYIETTGPSGGKAMYVQANGAIAATQSDILVSTAGQASDGTGTWSNTVAFNDNEYGWVYLVDNT